MIPRVKYPLSVVFERSVTVPKPVFVDETTVLFNTVYEISGVYLSPKRSFVFTPVAQVEEDYDVAVMAMAAAIIFGAPCASNPLSVCLLRSSVTNLGVPLPNIKANLPASELRNIFAAATTIVSLLNNLPAVYNKQPVSELFRSARKVIEMKDGIKVPFLGAPKKPYILAMPLADSVLDHGLVFSYERIREAGLKPEDIDLYHTPYTFTMVFGNDALLERIGLRDCAVTELTPQRILVRCENINASVLLLGGGKVVISTPRSRFSITVAKDFRLDLSKIIRLEGYGQLKAPGTGAFVGRNGGAVLTITNSGKVLIKSIDTTKRALKSS